MTAQDFHFACLEADRETMLALAEEAEARAAWLEALLASKKATSLTREEVQALMEKGERLVVLAGRRLARQAELDQKNLAYSVVCEVGRLEAKVQPTPEVQTSLFPGGDR